NIELKTLPRGYPGLAASVIALVRRLGLGARTLVSSFDHEQLVLVRKLAPSIATGVLASDRLWHVTAYLEHLDADAFHPGCYGDYDSLGFGSVGEHFDARQVAAVRKAGKDVNVWTCNEPAQMRVLLDAGVSGVITDYPNRLAPLLASTA